MQDENNIPEYRISPDDLKLLAKSGNKHKYAYGHAIVVSGPAGKGGAARLAARGALRIGAGLVSVFCSRACQAEHAARLDAVMVKSYSDEEGFAEQLSKLKPSAVCIGPNLGLGRESKHKLAETLSKQLPLCLDADAITLIAQDPHLFKTAPPSQVVLTPHEGELRRLIPAAFQETSCRVSLAKIATQAMNCVVLFKGGDTVIAHPNGESVVVKSAPFEHAAWLATAGSGDVLSGFITGLMARGFDAFDAAALGANLHLQCADAVGPGLIAEDLPEALPTVLAHCLQSSSES